MMSCRQFTEQSIELDGDISWRTRLDITIHRLMCRHCRRFMVQMKLASELVSHTSQQQDTSEEDVQKTMENLHYGSWHSGNFHSSPTGSKD